MSTASRIIAAACTITALAGCGAPPVVDAQDKYDCPADGGPCALIPLTSVVSGTVIYQGARRGDAVLLLFSSTALPPPDGTATAPVEIARVPSATLFAGAAAGATGPFSAPYLFTEVPPGNYQIRAFLDLGGDFDPFADFTQSPHAGAPTGGTVTFDANGNATLADFNVPSNVQVLEQVVLGQEVPFDPPAFQIPAGQTIAFPQNIDRPQSLTLTVFNPGVPHATFANPKFTLQLHPSAAGTAQESGADGLLDVYPQVTLLQTSAVQPDGSTAAVSGAAAAIVPCKVLPISTWPLLVAQPAGQFGLDTLNVLIEPFAVQISAAGVTTELPAIPAGQYELVVAERTGQVWTLPNSLGSQSSTSGFYVASQATSISFTAVVQAGGAITGKINFPAPVKPHNLILQAFAGGPALAPPLSVQVPARVLSIPGEFLPVDSAGNIQAVPYTLAGLSPGTYAVLALDDADGNYNDLDILETPTRGDIVGGVFDNLGHLASITVGSAPVNEDITMVGAPGQNGQGVGTPLDPPAFVYAADGGVTQIAQDAVSTVRIAVQAQPDVFPALDQDAASTVFTVALVRDSLGNVVDSDGDGLPDLWPRAFLLEIDPADPQGLALKSPLTALPAAVDPTPFLPALLAGDASTVLPATSLSIIVRPTAVDLTNPAAPARLPQMPAGTYKLILMNETGQLWQVPNSSGSADLDPRAAALVNTASQSQRFSVVPPAAAVNAGEIDGAVSLTGITSFKSVYVFAYSVDDPPPPLGTGKPVSADFHTAAEFSAAGMVSYALRGLAAGAYYVTAVCDTRGDFAIDPFLFAAAPGPGDFIGGYLDASFALAPVNVAGVVPDIGVAIAGGASRALPARPSFTLESNDVALTEDITTLFPDAVTPQRITLQAQTELGSGVVAIDPESGPAFFPVTYQSCSAADMTRGADADFDNLPDLYPRILVVKLSDADSSGLTVDGSNTVIPAAIDPTPYLAALGNCSAHNVVPATSLGVILQPIAVQETATSRQQLPIPAGRYGIFLESETGQVWRLPNELQPALLDPRSAATSAGQLLATQGVAIRVSSQVPAARGGAITGTVSLSHETALGNLIVAAYAADAPPPPLGTGRPLAVQVITSAAVEATGTSPVPYLLANLPPGSYLLLALYDPLDEFSPSLDYLSTPPQGAQVSFAGGATPSVIEVGDTVAIAPAIALDADSTTETIPFPRPAFSLEGTLSLSSSAPAGTAQTIDLVPDDPAGVPFALPAPPAFHPTPARNESGLPYTDPTEQCTPGHSPYVSSMAYATPIDTGSTLVAYVSINSCQFCQSLTGTADCSGALLAMPQPLTAPLAVTVTNLAVNPETQALANAPLPPGHYAITLIEETGQSWTVPNALSSADPSQGAVFTVTP